MAKAGPNRPTQNWIDAGVRQSPASPRHLFSAPWEPVVVRRGDALGLRSLADQFADAVAPDLNNRIQDGRWVTILAWCLARSHEVFHACRGGSVVTRAQQRERYAWLRPLELMWVARTIALTDDWSLRSLSGQRRVGPWYTQFAMAGDPFGMSDDQFRAYRQTGMYGGYRLAFRKWPGMTTSGDGWTPSKATQQLAVWLDRRLGAARPSWPLHDTKGDDDRLPLRSAHRGRGAECQWWLRRWRNFDHGGERAERHTLPRRRDDFEVLPEADILRPLLFHEGDRHGRRRLAVARHVAGANTTDHLRLCESLADGFSDDKTIAQLPHFSRLADAGMSAMDLVASSLRSAPKVKLSEVAAMPGAAAVCAELLDAAKAWRGRPAHPIRHAETADRLAEAISSARPVECLEALLRYHEIHGGGLRWFVVRDGMVEPRTPSRGGASSYRFRLRSLCRLAVQCGTIESMPAIGEAGEDPGDNAADDSDE